MNRYSRGVLTLVAIVAGLFAMSEPLALRADDSSRILTIDHYLRVTSSVPVTATQCSER